MLYWIFFGVLVLVHLLADPGIGLSSILSWALNVLVFACGLLYILSFLNGESGAGSQRTPVPPPRSALASLQRCVCITHTTLRCVSHTTHKNSLYTQTAYTNTQWYARLHTHIHHAQ